MKEGNKNNIRKVGVSVPLTGVAYVELEVEDNATEDEILDMAYDEITLENIEEWELTDRICRGNIFYGVMNTYEINDIED